MKKNYNTGKTYEEMFGVEKALEIKEKQRQFNLKNSRIPPNMKGKKLSAKARKNISVGKTGKARPDMIGNSFRKGKIPWNKGVGIGKKDLQRQIRCCSWYKTWQKKVKKPRVCSLCNSSHRLEAHHLIKLKDILKEYLIKTLKEAYMVSLLWDVKNGVCLCHKCHKSIYGNELQFRIDYFNSRCNHF